MFYHSGVREEVLQIRGNLSADTRWVCLDSEEGPDHSLDAFTAAHRSPLIDWGVVEEDHMRRVQIRETSGTSGPPKLVLDRIQSFSTTYSTLRNILGRYDCDPVFVAAAPLSHACGVFALAMLTLGATVIVVPIFDPAEVLGLIQKHRVTHIWLPPTALYLLLDTPEVKFTDHSSLKCMVLGAAAVSPDKLREAIRIFGPCVTLNYSQIECGFLTWLDEKTMAAAAAGDHPERLLSSGSSMYSARVAIMSDEGQLEPRGQVGEIVVRGPAVKEYGDARETEEARRFGWHHTGDTGYLDEAGYLYVVGRKKDIVITGGFKVSASEVERVIMELPQIADCAVIAAPDPVRGEAVVAVVSLRPGQTLASPAIIAHCKARLGSRKAPRAVDQWTELPRTPVGKVDKLKIRAKYLGAATSRTEEPGDVHG